MAVFAKVVRTPGALVEVMLNDGATVAEALTAGGFELASGEGLTMNGAPVSTTDSVVNGAAIVIAKAFKGAHPL